MQENSKGVAQRIDKQEIGLYLAAELFAPVFLEALLSDPSTGGSESFRLDRLYRICACVPRFGSRLDHLLRDTGVNTAITFFETVAADGTCGPTRSGLFRSYTLLHEPQVMRIAQLSTDLLEDYDLRSHQEFVYVIPISQKRLREDPNALLRQKGKDQPILETVFVFQNGRYASMSELACRPGLALKFYSGTFPHARFAGMHSRLNGVQQLLADAELLKAKPPVAPPEVPVYVLPSRREENQPQLSVKLIPRRRRARRLVLTPPQPTALLPSPEEIAARTANETEVPPPETGPEGVTVVELAERRQSNS